jgi:hypothetical protein
LSRGCTRQLREPFCLKRPFAGPGHGAAFAAQITTGSSRGPRGRAVSTLLSHPAKPFLLRDEAVPTQKRVLKCQDAGRRPPAVIRSRLRVKLRRTQCEHMFSGLPLKADIAQCSRHVSKVPFSDSRAAAIRERAAAAMSAADQYQQSPRIARELLIQAVWANRVSISSLSKMKSMGLVNKPSAPLSIALRLVSGSP